jgi:hypothetical protein
MTATWCFSTERGSMDRSDRFFLVWLADESGDEVWGWDSTEAPNQGREASRPEDSSIDGREWTIATAVDA